MPLPSFKMKVFVPSGMVVDSLNVVGPCWISYDSSLKEGRRWATQYLHHDEVAVPEVLDLLGAGNAEVVYMTPGIGSAIDRLAALNRSALEEVEA